MVLASSSVHVVEGAPKNGCCQCLCPEGELQLPIVSLKDSSGSAGGTNPSSCQFTASSLGPAVYEILCALFKSEVSIFSSPLGFLKVSPADLQSQMLWGFIFPVLVPQAEEPNVGLRPLTPLGEPLQL